MGVDLLCYLEYCSSSGADIAAWTISEDHKHEPAWSICREAEPAQCNPRSAQFVNQVKAAWAFGIKNGLPRDLSAEVKARLDPNLSVVITPEELASEWHKYRTETEDGKTEFPLPPAGSAWETWEKDCTMVCFDVSDEKKGDHVYNPLEFEGKKRYPGYFALVNRARQLQAQGNQVRIAVQLSQ